MIKYSDNPIVGQWIKLSGAELQAAQNALTETQKANLDNGGWARVSYEVPFEFEGNLHKIRYSQVVKANQ